MFPTLTIKPTISLIQSIGSIQCAICSNRREYVVYECKEHKECRKTKQPLFYFLNCAICNDSITMCVAAISSSLPNPNVNSIIPNVGRFLHRNEACNLKK